LLQRPRDIKEKESTGEREDKEKKKKFKVKNDAATPDGKPNQANAVIRGSELLAPLKMNPLIRRTPSPYNKEAEEKQVPRGGTRLQNGRAVPCQTRYDGIILK
jgi:hypothetical protein